VCWHHNGANRQVKRKAEMNVSLAQVDTIERRHPWEVLLDALHLHDVAVREYLAKLTTQLATDEDVTPDAIDRLLVMNQMRHVMAGKAIDAKAHERIALEFTRHLEAEGQLVGTALGAAIDKLGLTEDWRTYALAVARWTLLGEGDHERGDEPQPPEDPVVQVYESPVASNRPAIEAAPSANPAPCDVAALDDNELRDLGSSVLDELERRGVDG
jgi:hypothetical protein